MLSIHTYILLFPGLMQAIINDWLVGWLVGFGSEH